MRRTDRLFDMIQILRDGRLHKASEIAGALAVSTRTVWRDMGTLMASGLPVEGERGVGYILRAPITLPPMVLTSAELEAFRLGIRLVADGADAGLARAARSLANKIGSVTPAPPEPDDDGLFAFAGRESTRAAPHMPMLRAAIRGQERLTITYVDSNGLDSHRDIRPLHLEFAGRVWTLAAWCEARADFRSFRVDRILAITPTGETFPDEPGRDLAAYKDRIKAEDAP
jgi:predicted DNA-binding transcriptional regulator YafY